MERIKCIAVDDEPLALNQIARFIGRIPELQLLGTCLAISQALEIMEKETVELVFLDIEMPGCSGVEFARRVQQTPSLANKSERGLSFIFTTAYPQYAVEGFRLDAVDYLLKPLSFEELQTAVEKLKHRLVSLTTAVRQVAEEQADSAKQSIFVKTHGTVRKLHIPDIVYIQGLGAYVQICMKNEHKLLTIHESLKNLEQFLPQDCFIRIHKSYLINISFLESSATTTATLSGKVLPIGQKYRAAFKQFIKQHIANL